MKISQSHFKLTIFVGIAVVIVSLTSARIIPLYDGVAFPDEQYRYVSSAQKNTAQAPTTAGGPFSLPLNTKNNLLINSAEQGPQVTIDMSPTLLHIPASASQFELLAEPLAPATQPKDGSIAGNVYKVSARSSAGIVSMDIPSPSSNMALIDLRLPQGFEQNPVMEYMPDHGTWRKINTTRYGNDIYESSLVGFGYYALVKPRGSQTAPPQAISKTQKSHTHTIVLVSAVLLVGLVVVPIVQIRRHSDAGKKSPKHTP